YLVWMAIFIIVPLGMVCYYGLTDDTGAFSIENLSHMGRYSNIFFRSIWLAIIATVICLVVAYPLAYILSRMDVRRQSTMLLLVMLPMWMNFLLRTYAWMTLLEANGVINKLLGLIGLGPYEMINTQGAIVLGMVYNYLPFMILPLYSVMTKIDTSLIEAAQDLGCSSRKVLTRVIIPLSKPGIMTGITMVFVPSVSTFIISRMLGGGSNMLIGDLIEQQILGTSYNINLGAAISIVLMVLILMIMTVMNQFDDEEMEGMII
ncbi:MAG: ABC transporter permease, partial [Clostridiales bacterium]|nr:ABC transporter permease [Clostridiales bacterium]